MNKTWKLPSFMRKRELKQYEQKGQLHYIYNDNEEIGFYVLEEKKFKNLFVSPEYRGRGIATQIIRSYIPDGITICTTKRMCKIKRLIMKLGFHFTGEKVQGKQSELEIWSCAA